jgi:outer membrane lipoprotein SlyB
VPTSRATATLQQGGALAQGDLDEPLLLTAVPLPWADAEATLAARSAPTPAPAVTVAPPASAAVVRGPERATCADCAWVQSVRRVETPPGGAIGAIAGAIAGAVLGEELGKEHTRRVLAVLGAIGGAVAGHQIGQQATRRVHYEVVLRTSDGGAQVRRFDHAPAFAAGDTVRLGALGETPSPF